MTLKTETNTPTMERRIRSAFAEWVRAHGRPRRSFSADFEHGQWWITDLDTGAQWSVVDCSPGYGDGFDFERVTDGTDL